MERDQPLTLWNATLKLNVWVWIALVPLLISHANSKLAQAISRKITNDNHPGFISIDCGSDFEYVDTKTGFRYQTDEDFIGTGINRVASSMAGVKYFGKQLKTMRCFPKEDRNCYALKPEQGKNNINRYLIRAFFVYGNYDGKNQTPSFDLYLGVDQWASIIVSVDKYFVEEIIHTPSTDIIHVCLVKTGPTIPCISSLELRPLNTSIYPVPSTTTPQPLLSLIARVDVDSRQLDPQSRYEDDIYDRTWRYDRETDDWYSWVLDGTINIDPKTTDNAYKLPAKVLRTAATSSNVSRALAFDFNSYFWRLDSSSEYAVFLHFAEIQQLRDGHKRIMNITINSVNILSKPLVLEYSKPVTITPQNATPNLFQLSITATPESDAPPILNAFEVYKLITDLSSPTDNRDVGAIMDIKTAYQISRSNWQGDPCVPKAFAWDGLGCNSYTNPRINSLNLSSSKLAGKINTSFSYLTELEFLDLSNNELEGPLPEFLAELPKLKTLNLTGNKLSGPIPKVLKEKAETTLQLRLLL